jgi:catechol 2,3-dioxygenase-like lactoylglutathione lyase family enzyme
MTQSPSPAGFVEHVNITVRDPAKLATLCCDLFGWHVRWQGHSALGGDTIHVGNENCYLAIYTDPTKEYGDDSFKKGRPLNHIGIVVDDLDAVEAKVKAAGLAPFSHDDYEPGRRFYFYDFDGIEFEIVSYS